MRLINPLILIAMLVCYSAFAVAQMTYGDRRFEADSNPKTVEARRHFSELMTQVHFKLQVKFELPNVQLLYNPRMVSQYGRGADSTFRVIPVEHGQIMALISSAKKNPDGLLQLALVSGFRNEGSEQQIRKAIADIANIKIVYIDYWGYLGRVYKPPVYKRTLNRITFYANWHERESLYEETAPEILRYQILKAFISSK